ncbi:class I SAM-dependent methyltransferase [Rubricoccus marinus]|uniref:SAM-dependent methyltransferase n=1 Tax=Rubricoccus marinus TaxID=716817 RepID=A0A259TZ48_9BACT|nr:class I SAM-dependent methyltransferase [Rubricoccus marinus]OZC02970.1 SAM-dependent methyltransferase [Rubricoccus marinus]
MRKDELVAVFDKQAKGYDAQWEGMAPLRDALYLLVKTAFVGLPTNARVLCVGVGTGVELAYLARSFPAWRFTAVEPSGTMLDVCRQRAEREGFASRCVFHQGYLDSLPTEDAHDAATCFLVSQFILDREARSGFFRGIAERLRPGGLLASSDLARGAGSDAFDVLLRAWLTLMAGADVSAEQVERSRKAYAKDVAVLHPSEVTAILRSGGFETPVQVFQAGLLHAWLSRRP